MCDICGRPPEWSCEFCDSKLLCDGCDHKWHSHQRRNKHHRTHLGQSTTTSLTTTTTPVTNGGLTPGTATSPPPLTADPALPPKGKTVGDIQSVPQLPTVLESVRTFNSAVGFGYFEEKKVSILHGNSSIQCECFFLIF